MGDNLVRNTTRLRSLRPRSLRPRSLRPRSMRPRSIRARMTLGFAAFIALLMLLFCAIFYLSSRHRELQNAEDLLQRTAQEIRQDIAENAAERNDSESKDAKSKEAASGMNSSRDGEARSVVERWRLRDFSADADDSLAIWVLDVRGRVVEHSAGAISTLPQRDDSWLTTSVSDRENKVVIAWPRARREHALRERTALLLALSLLVVVATAGGAWVSVGRVLSPIDELARQAQHAARATSSTRSHAQLQAPSPDAEIARLVATLNDLLARWSETAQSRERFYAAAAHELRTPLQALSGHLEVALNRERSAHDYRSALEESHAQTERLTSLVQDLLLMNQLEAQTLQLATVDFDLVDVCENELRPLRALAEARNLRIELDLPTSCELRAPWNHATMLVRNLLENAIKYATENGVVRVALDGKALSICNDCASEIAPTERWFEPFFRPDISRTSATGGNGLGLAICRSICDANGWEIALAQVDNRLCARVDFSANAEFRAGNE